ncbi:HAMP domain-containing histidine kinase [Pontimonas sp.]|nr:HAMP domain-containing sensor histidine kinase [Pontimonas sp.]MDA8887022.1 HAMP domain-containing histidine kinase [Pontimonas sp.]
MRQWWESTSLRTKITGLTVIVITLGLFGIGVGTMTTVQQYLLDEVDRKIDEVAAGLSPSLTTSDFASFDTTGQTGSRSSYFLAAISDDGEVLASNLEPGNSEYQPNVSGITQSFILNNSSNFTVQSLDGNTEWRLHAYSLRIIQEANMTQEDAALIIGVDLEESKQTVGRFATIFLLFGLAAVLFSAILTRFLVTTTFRPLREVEMTAARFAGGDFSQRLGGATPNTEVGRLTRSLNTMLSRIDRAFADRADTIEQMRRFIGDASHELRTPLVSVRGYAELYRMGALPKKADVAQAMERIEKEAERMTTLVTDLLELARLDEAKPLELGPVNLVGLAHDQAMDAQASAPGRTVTLWHEGELVHDPTAIPPIILSAEENKIRQVLANLLQNALRFSPDNTPIEVIVQRETNPARGVVSVVDHGEGIPLQLRDKIFQRLFRADTSRARETGGSGLGLAIVDTIVRRHKGTIRVEETPGGGATFRLSLPLVPKQSS